MYNINYCTSHNDLITDLELLCIPEAMFNARTFKFDTNLIVDVTFDISFGFC